MSMNPGQTATEGTLELGPNGSGFLRDSKRNYAVFPKDPMIGRDLIHRFRLRGGETITGTVREGGQGRGPRGLMLTHIATVNGRSVQEYSRVPTFEDLTVIS